MRWIHDDPAGLSPAVASPAAASAAASHGHLTVVVRGGWMIIPIVTVGIVNKMSQEVDG